MIGVERQRIEVATWRHTLECACMAALLNRRSLDDDRDIWKLRLRLQDSERLLARLEARQ